MKGVECGQLSGGWGRVSLSERLITGGGSIETFKHHLELTIALGKYEMVAE